MAFSKPVLTAIVLAAVTSAGQVAVGLAAPLPSKILAVGAENEYSNVIAQVGGSYVKVTSILSNPNTDPHSFEASPAVAEVVGAADLVVQNGLGYDSFMNKIEAASPSHMRHVIDVQQLLRLAASTPNPHLWYKPATMPAVARAVAAVLTKLAPSHAAYFQARAHGFDASLGPWYHAIAQFRERFPHASVAVTEPVGDYLLQAVGADNRTPWTLQADIMNGVDPAPQAVSFQDGLFSHHKVKVFLYNQQVTDSLTDSFLALSKRNGIPVVGLYETMPSPGYDYQAWMLAETKALDQAFADKQSTMSL
ncbi:MAG TPA: zinc ABC transporter substrate-binding protein [Candidatus Dormibacteraeota bacterium]|nr:zinc ABC transporter substrate-binding protein [Candidatus Dormibacteraeota bacterium]